MLLSENTNICIGRKISALFLSFFQSIMYASKDNQTSIKIHVHALIPLLGITWQKHKINAAERFNFCNENSHVTHIYTGSNMKYLTKLLSLVSYLFYTALNNGISKPHDGDTP